MRRASARIGCVVVVLAACGPKPVAAPAHPEAPVVTIVPTPAPAEPSRPRPEPAPSHMAEIAGLDPDAQWAWAVERFPALAEHAAIDRGELLAQLPAWFPDGRVFVRIAGGKCFPVDGEWTGDAFVGRARETVKTTGRARERIWYTIEVSPGGIVETGPGAEVSTRNAKGKWEVTGGWGIGCMDVLANRAVSEVTADAVYFAAYDYTITIGCAGTKTETDACEGGGERVCTRCAGLNAQRHASGMGFGQGRMGIEIKASTPIDCSAPCPADTITPLVEPLNAIVKSRRFTGLTTMEGAVYKSRRTCERDPRWKVPVDAEDAAEAGVFGP